MNRCRLERSWKNTWWPSDFKGSWKSIGSGPGGYVYSPFNFPDWLIRAAQRLSKRQIRKQNLVLCWSTQVSTGYVSPMRSRVLSWGQSEVGNLGRPWCYDGQRKFGWRVLVCGYHPANWSSALEGEKLVLKQRRETGEHGFHEKGKQDSTAGSVVSRLVETIRWKGERERTREAARKPLIYRDRAEMFLRV